jgi:phosphate transport system permease protein
MQNRKIIEENFFKGLMWLATAAIIFFLLLILVSIFIKGVPYLSWEMLTHKPEGGYYFGKGGGILNAILGSIYLAFGSTILALVIGLPVALFMNVNMVKNKRAVNVIRFLLDLLWGIPSIVYGAFGFSLMIFFGIKTSLLAGIITVTLFIIPIMVRAIDEVLKTTPIGLMEASFSLGATKTETAFIVFIRQTMPGVVTAVLLAFGRAIGDAAAPLFTAGFTDNIPTSLTHPAATLPLSIFFQLSSPIPEVRGRAYASAVVLTVIILIISIVTRLISSRYQKNRIKF